MRNSFSSILLCFTLLLFACSSGLGESQLAQAEQEYTQGNFLKAEALYELYIQANPQGSQRWEAWNKLVEICITITRNHKKAAQLLEAMQLEYSDDPVRQVELAWSLAEVYTTLHDWDKGAETWQVLLDQKDLSAEQVAKIHWNLGKIYQYQGRYGMAKDSMLACMEKTTDTEYGTRCMYELAQAYSLLKNRDQAKLWLEKIIAQEGVDTETHALSVYLLSEVLENEGQIARARALLLSIKATYPNPKVIETRLQQLGK